MQSTLFDTTGSSAILSPCGLYRYTLERVTGTGAGTVNFVMLNPSVADATEDDPTIRRCIGFARSWDYMRLVVTNLFAFRATDPEAMLAAPDPIGPENDRHISEQARAAGLVVCAWGTKGGYHKRDAAVLRLIEAAGGVPRCLARTKDGWPQHPLYVKADRRPVAFEGRK